MVFTVRRYFSVVYSVIVCLSVHLSYAGIKMSKHRITDYDSVPSSVPNFTPIGAKIRVYNPKTEFLLIYDQNVEYKRPAEAYPLRDFHKIRRLCTSFQDALAVKVSLDLLKGLWGF